MMRGEVRISPRPKGVEWKPRAEQSWRPKLVSLDSGAWPSASRLVMMPCSSMRVWRRAVKKSALRFCMLDRDMCVRLGR